MPSTSNFAISIAKLRKNDRNAKEKLVFFSFPSACNFANSIIKIHFSRVSTKHFYIINMTAKENNRTFLTEVNKIYQVLGGA